MEFTVVNPQAKYGPVPLLQPMSHGYIHVAAAVEPPKRRRPRPGSSPAKTALLARLKQLADRLEESEAVTKATVYRTVVIPPLLTGYTRQAAIHPARYDVAVLIETTSPEAAGDVQAAEPYKLLLEAVQDAAADVHVMTARCAKRLADVDKARPGLFLFNYFVADDADVALELWEHLTGWFVAETGLDNSELMPPTGDSDYVLVNHARLNTSVPGFLLRVFTKPSFHTYVRPNLLVNRTGSMPLLYRLA